MDPVGVSYLPTDDLAFRWIPGQSPISLEDSVKRFYLTLGGLLLVGAALLPLACSYPPSYPPNYGGPSTNTPTPTATVPPAAILSAYNGGSGFQYSSTGTGGPAVTSPITISVGQSVAWDASNSPIHTLYIDNGTTCFMGSNGGLGNSSFPVTYTFEATGNYLAHCGIHGNCNAGASNQSCPSSGCTGMAVTIHVQ